MTDSAILKRTFPKGQHAELSVMTLTYRSDSKDRPGSCFVNIKLFVVFVTYGRTVSLFVIVEGTKK